MLSDTMVNSASLTEVECLEVLSSATCLVRGWCVQRDEDDRGHISLAILSDGAAHETVFLLWRENGQLHLGRAQDETYVCLGVHPTVPFALAAMQAVIAVDRASPQPGQHFS